MTLFCLLPMPLICASLTRLAQSATAPSTDSNWRSHSPASPMSPVEGCAVDVIASMQSIEAVGVGEEEEEEERGG